MKYLTINEFNALGEGYLRKTENDLNMQMKLLHQTAALIGIATNQPREYPKEPPQFELEKIAQNEEDAEKIRLDNLKKTAYRMWGQ